MILRLGQIVQAGDFSFAPGKAERSWIPGLLRTSKTLGCFPVDICDIDWLSINEASEAFFELSTKIPAESASELLVYNVVNPSPCKWKEILPYLHIST